MTETQIPKRGAAVLVTRGKRRFKVKLVDAYRNLSAARIRDVHGEAIVRLDELHTLEEVAARENEAERDRYCQRWSTIIREYKTLADKATLPDRIAPLIASQLGLPSARGLHMVLKKAKRLGLIQLHHQHANDDPMDSGPKTSLAEIG